MLNSEPPDVKSYQRSIAEMLRRIYPQNSVCIEWQAMRGERGVYSPRVDVAVGPFATGRDQRYARCFLAIEVENKTSRKHLMGSAINAAALGRIGVGVAWDEKVLRIFVRMRSYLKFLQRVGKPTFDTTNLVILDRFQFLDVLRQVND